MHIFVWISWQHISLTQLINIHKRLPLLHKKLYCVATAKVENFHFLKAITYNIYEGFDNAVLFTKII